MPVNEALNKEGEFPCPYRRQEAMVPNQFGQSRGLPRCWPQPFPGCGEVMVNKPVFLVFLVFPIHRKPEVTWPVGEEHH